MYRTFNAASRLFCCAAAALLVNCLFAGCSSDSGSENADAGLDDDAPFDGGVDAEPDGSGGSELAIHDVVAVPNPGVPLSFFVDFRTGEPASANVAVSCEGEHLGEFATADAAVPSERFSMVVLGLLPDATCEAVVTVTTSDDRSVSGRIELSTPDVTGDLPAIDLPHAATERVSPGWTLFNLNNHFDDVPLTIAAVDERGRWRWYHRRATPRPGAATEVGTYGDDILVGGTVEFLVPPAILDWSGSIVWEGDFRMHHDIQPAPSEGRIIYLGKTAAENCPEGVGIDTIFERSLESGEISWEWRICDHIVPPRYRNDWDHLNAAEPVDGGDALLVSSRDLSQIIKVAYPNGDVLWQLGEGGDFAMEEEARFLRQHAPEQQESGNILLFDNGSTRRPISRAVEIAIDTETMEATLAWEYAPDPPIFAPIWGDADRLDNGNTLMTFGRRSDEQTSHIIEVTPAGERVLEIVLPPKWGAYRAMRVDPPPVGWFVGE